VAIRNAIIAKIVRLEDPVNVRVHGEPFCRPVED
jgi:hypothetical protein